MGRSALWYPAGTTLADGDPVVLDDGSPGPMFVMQGATGIEAPTWTVDLESAPGVRAAEFVQATANPRAIKLPIHLCADTRAEMRRIKHDLLDAIDPEEGNGGGPGILALSDAIGEDSGEVRCIDAVYAGGLEGDEAAVKVGGGRTYWEFIIEFTGMDFWYSPEPVTATWQGAAFQPFFGSPFFPFSLAPYGLTATVPLALGGSALSWPTLQLGAPFLRMRLINDRSGEWWQVTRGGELQAQSLAVDTQPGRVRVRDLAGGNAYDQLSWQGDNPFALRPGDSLSIEAEGTSVATVISLSVLQRWKSAP